MPPVRCAENPDRTVRWGPSTQISQNLTEAYIQPVVIDNRPSAGGNIDMRIVVNAPNESYTLGLSGELGRALGPLSSWISNYRQSNPFDYGRHIPSHKIPGRNFIHVSVRPHADKYPVWPELRVPIFG